MLTRGSGAAMVALPELNRICAAVAVCAVGLQAGCVAPHYHQSQLLGRRAPELRTSRQVQQHLSRKKDREVTAIGKVTGVVTTPFKAAGVFGWTDYNLSAKALGRVVAAALSSDRFFTIDLHLIRFEVANHRQRLWGDRFLRAEIYLGWVPLDRAQRNVVGKTIQVSGPLVWDGDGHLEIHPRDRDNFILFSGRRP